MMPFAHLSDHLEVLSKQGLYRARHTVDSPQGIFLQREGQIVINFCSNDYLGLANHPVVLHAFKDAAERYGVGSGSAHLICGHSNPHHALEEELAAFTGRDRALLFSTGFMANIGVITALVGRGDWVLEDRLNHASLLDGGLLSGANFKRYGHGLTEQVAGLLARASGHKLIVTDGVFSMDGDFAPLADLAALAQAHQAWLMVDDAHGLGVLGASGGGLVQHLGLTQSDVPVLMATLGKSLGAFGAFVAGSEALIETLIQKARTYIYTTALPPAIASATRASLSITINETWRRDKLATLVSHFRRGAEQLGLPLGFSSSPIQPIMIGDTARATIISDDLLRMGFLVSAIRPPTVPKGTARLRVTLSAAHEFQHVDQLLEALASVLGPSSDVTG